MIDYSTFPIPKQPDRPKPEVKKDGRVVLSEYKIRKIKNERFVEGMPCAICGDPIECFADYELDHIEPKGMGGGFRRDVASNFQDTHRWCNRDKGSRRI